MSRTTRLKSTSGKGEGEVYYRADLVRAAPKYNLNALWVMMVNWGKVADRQTRYRAHFQPRWSRA